MKAFIATKKPVTVKACKWTGSNMVEVYQLFGNAVQSFETDFLTGSMEIDTTDVNFKADKGDYIIKDANGEFHACKPDVFEATYDF